MSIKKFAVSAVAVVLLAGALWAQQEWSSGATTVTFNSDDGTLTVSGAGRMADYTPSATPWATSGSAIKKVVIEEGVTHIGTYAFHPGGGMVNVESVSIPRSVTFIGVNAIPVGEKTMVTIRNPTPPQYTLRGIHRPGCLYVPANSVDAYRSNRVWGKIACIQAIGE